MCTTITSLTENFPPICACRGAVRKKAGGPAPRRRQNTAAGAGAAAASVPDSGSLRGVFVKELADIMVAFGDSQRGTPESLEAMEGIAIDFVRGVITKAVQHVRAFLQSGSPAELSSASVAFHGLAEQPGICWICLHVSGAGGHPQCQ